MNNFRLSNDNVYINPLNIGDHLDQLASPKADGPVDSLKSTPPPIPFVGLFLTSSHSHFRVFGEKRRYETKLPTNATILGFKMYAISTGKCLHTWIIRWRLCKIVNFTMNELTFCIKLWLWRTHRVMALSFCRINLSSCHLPVI